MKKLTKYLLIFITIVGFIFTSFLVNANYEKPSAPNELNSRIINSANNILDTVYNKKNDLTKYPTNDSYIAYLNRVSTLLNSLKSNFNSSDLRYIVVNYISSGITNIKISVQNDSNILDNIANIVNDNSNTGNSQPNIVNNSSNTGNTQANILVNFNGNGGTGHSPLNKTVTNNTAIGTLPSNPIRTGYTFNGWFTAPTGGTQITTSTLITGNITYYAQWNIYNTTLPVAGAQSTLKFPNINGSECDTIIAGGKNWATCDLAGGKQYQWGRNIGFAPGVTPGSTNTIDLAENIRNPKFDYINNWSTDPLNPYTYIYSIDGTNFLENAIKSNKILIMNSYSAGNYHMGYTRDGIDLGKRYINYLQENPPEGWYGNNPQGPCPSGWHIPTTSDINMLMNEYNSAIKTNPVTGLNDPLFGALSGCPYTRSETGQPVYSYECLSKYSEKISKTYPVLTANLINTNGVFNPNIMTAELSIYRSSDGITPLALDLKPIRCVKN